MRRWRTNIELTLDHPLVFAGKQRGKWSIAIPANTTHSTNVGVMLGQRRSRTGNN